MSALRLPRGATSSLRRMAFAFRLVFQERMAYRTNFFLEILSQVLATVILVLLWMAVYRSAGTPEVGGYTLSEMVTYLLGAGLIGTFILTTADSAEAAQSILDGDLSGLLVRPMSPCALWFARDLGSKAFLLLLGAAGYLAVLALFSGHLLPPRGASALAASLSLAAAGALLQFLLFQALNFLAFWAENTYGFTFAVRVLMEVAGGALIPLSLLPGPVRTAFLATPFPFTAYLPMQAWLGKLPATEALSALGVALGWAAALGALNALLWRRGLRQYVSMGD